MTKNYKVTGIGNAIVDVLAKVSDEFIIENNIERGIMQLIDTVRATELYSKMGPAREVSGGSVANTIASVATLGVSSAYVGKVKDDQLGRIFSHDIKAQGVVFDISLAAEDHALETGRCYVLVSPDGERTMNTYLGISETLGPDDIDEKLMADSDWIYLEGYRFDGEESHAAFSKAIKACKSTGGKVSLTLSDPFCVDRHFEAFKTMVKNEVDLLFCNEHELKALYQTDDLEVAISQAIKEVEILGCTIGEKGARIVTKSEDHHVPAYEANIVDATGAGDLFAAGFFYGITSGYDLKKSGQMGCAAASEIISHLGARPEENLITLFKKYQII